MNFRRFIPCAIALLISTFVSSSDATLIVHGARHYIADSPGGGNGALDYYGYTCERYVDDAASGSGDGLTVGNAWTWSQAVASGASLVNCIEPGTYTDTSTSSNSVPVFNPPSGSVGDPTVVVAKRAAAYNATNRSTFSNGVTTGDAGSVTIGISGRDYVTIVGVHVDENTSRSAADTGPIVIWGSDNAIVEGARVDGITIARASQDNHNAIRIENSTNWTVKNNWLQGVHEQTGVSQNAACIMVYSSSDGVIEHNFIDDCDSGIFIKGQHDCGAPNPCLGAITTRYNWVEDMIWAGINIGGPNVLEATAENPTYGNMLLRTGFYGLSFNSYDSVSPSEIWAYNNTIVDVDQGVILQVPGGANSYRDVRLYANLVVRATNMHRLGFDGEMSDAQLAQIEAQMTTVTDLRNYNVGYTITNWARQEDVNKSLATWVTDSGWDANSQELSGNPFVDETEFLLNDTAGAGATAKTASNTAGHVGFTGSGGTPGLEP